MKKLDYPYIWVRKPESFTWLKRNALHVLWAKTQHNNSELNFDNGEVFISALSLTEFHQYVWPSALFRRWHESYLIRRNDIADCRWLFAIMKNGKTVPVSRTGYEKTKLWLIERDGKR